MDSNSVGLRFGGFEIRWVRDSIGFEFANPRFVRVWIRRIQYSFVFEIRKGSTLKLSPIENLDMSEKVYFVNLHKKACKEQSKNKNGNNHRLENRIYASLSLRKTVMARFSGVRRHRSFRPTKLDTENATSDGTLVPGVARNRRANDESNGNPFACVSQNRRVAPSPSLAHTNFEASRR